MNMTERFVQFYEDASADQRIKLDAIMHPNESLSFDERLEPTRRMANIAPDYASDAAVQAVRARFFRQAS